MKNVWTPHPLIPEPTRQQVIDLALRSKCSEVDAAKIIWQKREEAIHKEKADPLAFGWESPKWKLCHALLGRPWVDQKWAEQMRRACGFRKPVQILLIMGGQRGSKSEYAGKTAMRTLRDMEAARLWCLHTNGRMSVEYQQPLIWKYLPSNLRARNIATKVTYIKYTMKTGFSEGRFVMPNRSDCSFLSYEMDRTTVEGGNVDFIWPDELVPSDWVETMRLRIAEKRGIMIITFTPVSGYSDTVRMFLDGATVTRTATAFLLPKDGGEPDVRRALGLTEEEYGRLHRWIDDPVNRPGTSVWSRPQEVGEWIRGEESGTQEVRKILGDEEWGPGTGRDQPLVPAGRVFEEVPVVAKPRDPDDNMAVVWFHSSDNPYGNPLSVWRQIARGSREFKLERFYGVATKMITAKFPKFQTKVHVIRPKDVPTSGTRYHIVDPCSGRNWFMLWAIINPDGVYIYREWPGHYHVPNQGVPGDWAVPDGKKVDGRMGPAQKSFGWGFAQYKQEIARLEGWQEYARWEAGESSEQLTVKSEQLTGSGERWTVNGERGTGRSEQLTVNGERGKTRRPKTDVETVIGWDEHGPAKERMTARFLDARFGNVKSFEDGGMMTLIEQLEEIGLTFYPTCSGSRESIDAGVDMINDALFYDDQRPVDFFNRPRLYVSEACQNLIFAMQTWTGDDGQKGATKDPIDCLRFLFLANCDYQGEKGDGVGKGSMGGGVY